MSLEKNQSQNGPDAASRSAGDSPRRAKGVFSGLRIRKKLIVLHTSFSLALGILLLVALSPAMNKMVDGAEQDQAELILRSDRVQFADTESVQIATGRATERGINELVADRLRAEPSAVSLLKGNSFGAGIASFDSTRQEFVLIRTQSIRARKMVRLIYGLVIVTLFAGYAFVALALEMLVLPQFVYTPIKALLDADDAARSMDQEHELVPEELITTDELGEIMRSRNETVLLLRSHELELADALGRLETVAIDLHKKNRLLETARKNLEGADRLASLGMMSAGIAHELNTPLSVVKGLVEQLNERGGLEPSQIKLLSRVVGRIETLSEGLLDFSRVRSPRLERTLIHSVIEEAWMLIKLDRQSVLPGQQLEFVNEIDQGFAIQCDPGRMVQVFVNLIRNAVHALRDVDRVGRIVVSMELDDRDDGQWVVILVQDNGPGIDPAMLDSLFEPFASTKLDSQGTGLGLAVADGIIREHGGIVVPKNLFGNGNRLAADGSSGFGASFEIQLPISGKNNL